ncbi:zinc finger family protein [Hibiscus syriacus]|uniref:Zinc finger family protein n=1 Tax=Hibiscus syriacus TaxID=106335 RepID=A0A6A2WSU2_HIBSY|nr:zinc finger family protein [Hibiscus syriacus]
MSGPSLMDSLFQRSLEDLIKGLRQQLIGEQAFISKALEEIRKEIKSTDLSTKSTALFKLSYLSNLHFHDMSFAAFHALEVLSSPRFSHKKIAYQAISLSFHDSTPVLLITNHLRKDLNSTNEFEVSLSLQCLSRIANVDLARDLTPEVLTLLSSNKLYVRKRAVALVLRVSEKYPDFVRLACKDPRSYLPLAPEFYKILVDSKNNWISIKVLKIFSKLAPLEPRLAKQVVEPICDLLRNTGAKSLLFECIRTVVTGLSDYESAALRIVAEKHLWAVSENKEVVIKSLSDADPDIRIDLLRLVMAMVSEHNVNLYEIVVDFDWYVSLLGEMSRIPHCQMGEEIENQLIDIGMRVKDVSVLSAAAWASREYVELSRNPLELMEALLQPRTNATVVHDQTCASAFITKESIINLLNLVELALGPLLGSHNVEVQERSHNLFGFVDLTKPEILNSSVQEKEDSEGKGVETSKIIKLMRDAFSKELGPVSLSAQGKFSLPYGLVLKENLGGLEIICGDIKPPSSNSFSFASPYKEENDRLSFSNLHIKEDSEQSNESTSLLAEHRKRHELYYLHSVKSELISNDYPPANDPTLQGDINDNTDDLVKITAESLVPKRKPNHGKPWPVVVKLDKVDEKLVAMNKPESRDDSLSVQGGPKIVVMVRREDIEVQGRKMPRKGKRPIRKKRRSHCHHVSILHEQYQYCSCGTDTKGIDTQGVPFSYSGIDTMKNNIDNERRDAGGFAGLELERLRPPSLEKEHRVTKNVKNKGDKEEGMASGLVDMDTQMVSDGNVNVEMMVEGDGSDVDECVIDTSGPYLSIQFAKKVHERIDQIMGRSIIVRLLRRSIIDRIVRLLGRSIDYKTLVNKVTALWQAQGRFQVVYLDNEYYLIKFENEDDYEHDLSPTDHEPYMKLEYERLQQICFKCGMYGHSKDNCGNSVFSVENQVEKQPTEDNITHVVEEATYVFGPWMVAERRHRRSRNSGSSNEQTNNDVSKGSRFTLLSELNDRSVALGQGVVNNSVVGKSVDQRLAVSSSSVKSIDPKKKRCYDPVKKEEQSKEIEEGRLRRGERDFKKIEFSFIPIIP